MLNLNSLNKAFNLILLKNKQQCNDPETLDDLANRHVAQCSAENIMQWCTYIENFSLNQQIAPFLATEYHSKRVFIKNFFCLNFKMTCKPFKSLLYS